jgi:hypothetical protein
MYDRRVSLPMAMTASKTWDSGRRRLEESGARGGLRYKRMVYSLSLGQPRRSANTIIASSDSEPSRPDTPICIKMYICKSSNLRLVVYQEADPDALKRLYQNDPHTINQYI